MVADADGEDEDTAGVRTCGPTGSSKAARAVADARQGRRGQSPKSTRSTRWSVLVARPRCGGVRDANSLAQPGSSRHAPAGL